VCAGDGGGGGGGGGGGDSVHVDTILQWRKHDVAAAGKAVGVLTPMSQQQRHCIHHEQQRQYRVRHNGDGCTGSSDSGGSTQGRTL
jgi:hypothetical protein